MQPREQCDTGVDAGRNETARKRAEPGRPGHVRLGSLAACSLAAAFLVVFAVDLALFATPAQAQTTVWSATLNPLVTFSGDPVPLGCDNASGATWQCSNSDRLSDDDFTDDGTTYAVVKFVNESDGDLIFKLDMGATVATQGLTLVIDNVQFILKDADRIKGDKTQWKWLNRSLSWTAGTDVAVSLVEADALATGQPTISGAWQVSKTLTAATDDIEDPDGLPTTPTFTYQWMRVDGFTDTDIPGATSETYTLTASDLGKQIKMTVSFTDARGHAEGPLTSDAYPPNGTVLALPGPCPAVKDWCATMTVADDDGTGVKFGYEYDKFGLLTDDLIEYGGEELNVWTVYTALNPSLRDEFYFGAIPRVPLGTVITVGDLTFTTDAESDDGNVSDLWEYPPGQLPPDLLWSDGQEVRISLVLGNFPAEGAVTISGTEQVGKELTATLSGITDVDGLMKAENGDAGYAYSYQWYRVDGATETAIPDATGITYTLVEADKGKSILVKVSFTDDKGTPETLSDVSLPVGIRSAPRLVDDDPNAIWMATLTVADLGSNQYGYKGSQGGLTDTAFTYLGDDTPLSGGTYQKVGTRYTIDEAFYLTGGFYLSLDSLFVHDVSENILVVVDGTELKFSDASLSFHTYIWTMSDPTWSVGYEVPVKIVVLAEANGPVHLAATSAESGDQFDVTLTWTAPTSGGTVTGYRVESQPDPALQWRTLESSQSSTTYTDSGLARGTVRYYRVAALRSGGASYSDIVRVQAPSETQDVPLQVNYVDVKPAEGLDTALEVAWNRARTENSRAPATSYHVQYAQHDGAAPAGRNGEDWATVTFPRWMERLPWRTWLGAVEAIDFEESTEHSPALKTVVTGLTPGTNYRVRVRGCTAAGCGEWSYPRRWTTSGATSNATEAEPLTAAFSNVPQSHDGSTAFTFRLTFSEDVDISAADLKDHALTVTNGTVTTARALNSGTAEWDLTLQPTGTGPVNILVSPTTDCAATGALCTTAGTMLSTVPGQSIPYADSVAPVPQAQQALAPLAVSFVSVPPEHDGETAFWLELSFDAAVEQGSKPRIRALLGVTGGSETRIRRKDGRLDHWRIRIEPSSHAAVTVTLSPSPACGATGAVCTEDGRTYTTALATRIQGPPGFAVADAEVEEAANATLAFAVTLSRAPSGTVTVDYATADGTATAGSDYTATSGTLTFAAGETEKTVSVPVLDDAHDEGSETLTLTLSTAAGAYLADGTAIGTITNSDPMPEAWLARFGRTAATHVTDAVGERLRASPGQESQVTVGGYRLPLGQPASGTAEPGGATTKPETTTDRLASLLTGLVGRALGLGPAQPEGGGLGANPWADQPGTDPRLGQSQLLQLPTVRLRDVLLGSSFRLALAGDDARDGAMRLTAWGRVAGTRFDGRDGDLSLDGDVLTGTVGVDGEWDRLLAGVAVAHSRGQGGYTMPDMDARGEGDLETALTSIHPYLRYAVTERLDVWGLLGYGWGDLTLEPGADATFETDTTFIMGAFGSRGILLQASDSGGFQLATRTDAMLTRTSSDAVTTGDGNLASSEADAHRVRLVLEGSRGFTWPEGRTLTPTLEIGLRHDWGDAETGFGLELGGRVQYADPTLGLTIEGAVRGLLAHEDSDYQEWGASGSLRIAPGAGGQGLSLTLSSTWGAASSGIDGLWSRQTTAGLAPQGNRAAPTGRLNAEIGYGVAAPFSTGLLTPYAGTVLTDGAARTYRLGTRWTSISGLTLNLEGQRQEPAGQQPVNQGLQLQVGWGF